MNLILLANTWDLGTTAYSQQAALFLPEGCHELR